MYANLSKLRRIGFPDPLPVINRFAAAAIDAWIERQGLVFAATTAHVDKGNFDELFNF
ncbi:MAG: hypothetical protein JWL84_6215 [Rhodospirillales bacterium]|nr:hypothetical protein [Rhodospirillales bacterium]